MTEKVIVGRSPILGAANERIVTARFIAGIDGVEGVQEIGPDDLEAIKWMTPEDVGDPTQSWDNIGFNNAPYTGEYTTFGRFWFPTNMECLITVYGIYGSAPLTAGGGYVGLNPSSAAIFDEEDFRGLVDGHQPAMNVPGGRRYAAGQNFLVEASQASGSAIDTIRAAIYFLKVGTF